MTGMFVYAYISENAIDGVREGSTSSELKCIISLCYK